MAYFRSLWWLYPELNPRRKNFHSFLETICDMARRNIFQMPNILINSYQECEKTIEKI